MEQIFPTLLVVAIVAFVMTKQIKRLTGNTDDSPRSASSFELYAKFSAVIQEHIRVIKNDIDSSKAVENPKFKIIEGRNEAQALEKLSDFIRKLVFFETMMAKQKNPKEIEAELFEVLNGLETFIKEFCQEGENLAEELRESLLEAYESLQ